MTESNKMDRYNSKFCTNLRLLMEHNNTTQQELATFINTKRQSISQYADGSVIPNIEKLEKIADYFNVSCDYLLGKTEVSSPSDDIRGIYSKTHLSEQTIKVLMENKYKIPYFKWINRAFENIELLNNLMSSLMNYEELYISALSSLNYSKPLFNMKKSKEDDKAINYTNYKIEQKDDNKLELILSGKNANSLMKKIVEENFGILLQNILQTELESIVKEENENG